MIDDLDASFVGDGLYKTTILEEIFRLWASTSAPSQVGLPDFDKAIAKFAKSSAPPLPPLARSRLSRVDRPVPCVAVRSREADVHPHEQHTRLQDAAQPLPVELQPVLVAAAVTRPMARV